MRPISTFKKGLAAIVAAGAMNASAALMPVEQTISSNSGNFEYIQKNPDTFRSGSTSFEFTAYNPSSVSTLDSYDFSFMNKIVDDLWTLPANQSEFGTKENMVNSAMTYLQYGDSLAGEDVVDFGWNGTMNPSNGTVTYRNAGGIPDVTYQAFDPTPGKAVGEIYFDSRLLDANRNNILGEVGDLAIHFDTADSILASIEPDAVFSFDDYGVAPRAMPITIPEPSSLYLAAAGILAAYGASKLKK
jgi:hypothetical protein